MVSEQWVITGLIFAGLVAMSAWTASWSTGAEGPTLGRAVTGAILGAALYLPLVAVVVVVVAFGVTPSG